MDEDPPYVFDEYENLTLDYANIPYLGEIKETPLVEIVLKSYLYIMVIFFSLIGNTLIIIVVLRHKQMRTTTNYYIVNLAVADILVTLFCTWVHLVNNLNNDNWVLGRFFCKFNTFSQVLCLVASVLSLTLIAYDRFFGIVFALRAHMTSRKARFSIGIIWICSFAIAAPLLWFRELKERQWLDYTERWCDDTWPVETKTIPEKNFTTNYMPSRTIYFTFVSAVLYFFPVIVMSIAYSVIIKKLRSSTIPGEHVDSGIATQQKRKRKVIAMLVTIMAVFGVCWLPYQIVLLYSELRENRDTLGDWYFTMQFLAGFFAYSNSALNPLIYAGFNKNFKEALLNMKADLETYNSARRQSLVGMLRHHSRDSQCSALCNNKLQSRSGTASSKSTTASIRTTGSKSSHEGKLRCSSFDSVSPLLGPTVINPSPEVYRPSPEMLKKINEQRLEAEKICLSNKSTPENIKVNGLSRCRTAKEKLRRNLDTDEKSDVLFPLRRSHSFDAPDVSQRIGYFMHG